MKFVDEATIQVKAGKGGNGCVSFRREKFVAKGGPDGGNGGDGGNVYARASNRLYSLYDFRLKRMYEAQNGQGGIQFFGGIDPTVYEAADIDGASQLTIMVRIYFPLAIKMVASMERQITKAIHQPFSTAYKPSTSSTLKKLALAKMTPSKRATRSSFHTTFQKSLNFTSPKASPRIIIADACEPALPPVPISIGVQAVKTMPYTAPLNTLSLDDITSPDSVDDINSINSQGRRFKQMRHALVFKYGLSVGTTAAIFAMSSVFSSSMTVMASSTVTIPTRRNSLSTMGRAKNP